MPSELVIPVDDTAAAAGVSPYSTGGGTVLEHRYAAVLLASLLTGDTLEELGDPVLVPVEIKLQASQFSKVDDILITARPRPGGEEFRVAIGDGEEFIGIALPLLAQPDGPAESLIVEALARPDQHRSPPLTVKRSTAQTSAHDQRERPERTLRKNP